jgi:hypothetical protein
MPPSEHSMTLETHLIAARITVNPRIEVERAARNQKGRVHSGGALALAHAVNFMWSKLKYFVAFFVATAIAVYNIVDPAIGADNDVIFFKEPIHKVVESEESVVIPSLAPESWLRGAECGSLNIAVLPTATACATQAI